MLARDLEEKLTLKQKLEQELRRLKQVYGREAGDWREYCQLSPLELGWMLLEIWPSSEEQS